MMRILKIILIPFIAIGGLFLMAMSFISLGGSKERDKRHKESLKKKEKNKKKGAKIEKEYQKLDATDVTHRLNKLR